MGWSPTAHRGARIFSDTIPKVSSPGTKRLMGRRRTEGRKTMAFRLTASIATVIMVWGSGLAGSTAFATSDPWNEWAETSRTNVELEGIPALPILTPLPPPPIPHILLLPTDAVPVSGYAYQSSYQIGRLHSMGGRTKYQQFDSMIQKAIPSGYQATAVEIYSTNEPDEIHVGLGYIDASASTTLVTIASPSKEEIIPLDPPVADDFGYLVIYFENSDTNISEFNGGRIVLERLP